MTTALYSRVSTQEQAQDGYSISEQAERLRAYCKAKEWYDFKLYSDAGFSGANTDRPALRSMLSDIHAGRIGRVVVYKLDRLSRSQKDTLRLIEDEFTAHGVDFVSVTENFDTGAPLGKAMIGILSVFAQLEREQIRERMSMGKDARAKQGLFLGSCNVPTGYKRTNDGLIIDPYEADIVRRAFALCAAGDSVYQIAAKLNDAGLYIKNKPCDPANLRYLLQNETYTGKIRWHGEYYDGQQDAIIDQSTFDQAQTQLRRRTEAHKANRRDGRANSYLSGLLYCGCCGAKFSKRTCKEGRNYAYYACNSRTSAIPQLVKDKNCRNPYRRMEELDAEIFDAIRSLSLETDELPHRQTESTDPISDAIAQIDKKLARLVDLYASGEIPSDILQTQINALSEQKSKLSNELEEMKRRNETAMTASDAIPLIRSFGDILDHGDYDQIRTVITSLIDHIVIENAEDITIYWRFA